MTTLRELVDRYTDIYYRRDEAAFRAMVVDGCIRHDPGSTTTVSIEESVTRFRAFHEQLPGARFTNAYMWEHGDDTITVAYTVEAGDMVVSSIEVFRFADERVVEVWNAPVGPGAW